MNNHAYICMYVCTYYHITVNLFFLLFDACICVYVLQEPVIKIKLSDMKQLSKRRYLLKHVVCTVNKYICRHNSIMNVMMHNLQGTCTFMILCLN